MWLTNSSPYLCWLSSDGVAKVARTLAVEEGFLPGQMSASAQTRIEGWDQVLSFEDPRGRV